MGPIRVKVFGYLQSHTSRAFEGGKVLEGGGGRGKGICRGTFAARIWGRRVLDGGRSNVVQGADTRAGVLDRGSGPCAVLGGGLAPPPVRTSSGGRGGCLRLTSTAGVARTDSPPFPTLRFLCQNEALEKIEPRRVLFTRDM